MVEKPEMGQTFSTNESWLAVNWMVLGLSLMAVLMLAGFLVFFIWKPDSLYPHHPIEKQRYVKQRTNTNGIVCFDTLQNKSTDLAHCSHLTDPGRVPLVGWFCRTDTLNPWVHCGEGEPQVFKPTPCQPGDREQVRDVVCMTGNQIRSDSECDGDKPLFLHPCPPRYAISGASCVRDYNGPYAFEGECQIAAGSPKQFRWEVKWQDVGSLITTKDTKCSSTEVLVAVPTCQSSTQGAIWINDSGCPPESPPVKADGTVTRHGNQFFWVDSSAICSFGFRSDSQPSAINTCACDFGLYEEHSIDLSGTTPTSNWEIYPAMEHCVTNCRAHLLDINIPELLLTDLSTRQETISLTSLVQTRDALTLTQANHNAVVSSHTSEDYVTLKNGVGTLVQLLGHNSNNSDIRAADAISRAVLSINRVRTSHVNNDDVFPSGSVRASVGGTAIATDKEAARLWCKAVLGWAIGILIIQ